MTYTLINCSAKHLNRNDVQVPDFHHLPAFSTAPVHSVITGTGPVIASTGNSPRAVYAGPFHCMPRTAASLRPTNPAAGGTHPVISVTRPATAAGVLHSPPSPSLSPLSPAQVWGRREAVPPPSRVCCAAACRAATFAPLPGVPAACGRGGVSADGEVGRSGGSPSPAQPLPLAQSGCKSAPWSIVVPDAIGIPTAVCGPPNITRAAGTPDNRDRWVRMSAGHRSGTGEDFPADQNAPWATAGEHIQNTRPPMAPADVRCFRDVSSAPHRLSPATPAGWCWSARHVW